MRIVKRHLLEIGLATCLLVVGGCARSDGDQELVVSAAASLSEVFEVIARDFEAAHPDVDVVLNVGGSSSLREQIVEGAPTDVFASASLQIMASLADSAHVGTPMVFAANQMVLAVPDGNPGDVQVLADLERSGLYVGLCAEAVPCGEYANQVAERAGVVPSVDTREPDVRALVTKVVAGELDVGLVYLTDVEGTDGIEAVRIPDEYQPKVEYPIAVVADSDETELANAFVEYVRSEAGRAVLKDRGFGVP